jgi:hypothetical protein
MRLQGNVLLVLVGLLIVTGIGAGCKSPMVVLPTLRSEPLGRTSPLAQPPTGGPLSTASPLARPTVGQVSTSVPVRPNEAGGTIPARAAEAVTWAQADLAARLGVSIDQIVVVSVVFVEWRDASLGCPQPGMMYAQVITPGYRILLRGGEKLYEYHSAQGGDKAIFCRDKANDLPALRRSPLPTLPLTDITH